MLAVLSTCFDDGAIILTLFAEDVIRLARCSVILTSTGKLIYDLV